MAIRLRHRLIGLAFLLAGSMAATTLLAGPASAATQVQTTGNHRSAVSPTAPAGTTRTMHTMHITARRAAAPGSSAAKALPADAPPYIECTLSYSNPYIIDPGGLNLIASNALELCTSPVDEISLGDLLLWNTVNTFGYDGHSSVLTTAVAVGPTDQCVSGVFQSQVSVDVIFPPGYIPEGFTSGTVTTDPQWYDC